MTTKKPKDNPTKETYVVLQRILHKSASPDYEIIEPAEDPFAADAPRITLEHLSPIERRILTLRNVVAIAPESEENNKEI